MSERYEIKGRLGRGGIGAVYEGYDMQLNRAVAIKRLLPLEETQLNESNSGSLTREALALASFQHPNVVTIFGFEEDSDGPFVVTELIDGKNLKETVAKGALSVTDFQEFVFQALDAMIAAEKLNLLHRDIKPANIMLLFLPSGRFQVKILDFGLAKFSQTPSAQTLDHKGSFLGSIDYIAPEQIERLPLDQRTDLYSFGCVCYFALTQQPPFEGATLADTMQNHLSHKVTPVCHIRPDLPSALGDWIMHMISLKPKHRPKSATAAVQEFEKAKQGISPKLPEETDNTTSSQPIKVTHAPGTESQRPAKKKKERMMITGSQPVATAKRNIGTVVLRNTGRQPTAMERQTASINQKQPKKNNLIGPLIGLGIAVLAMIIGLVFLLSGAEEKEPEAEVVPRVSKWKKPETTPADPPTKPKPKPVIGFKKSEFKGIVLDDDAASFVGGWGQGNTTPKFIGDGYRYDKAEGRGKKSATFTVKLEKAGKYEIRLGYNAALNRATKVPVTVLCGGKEQTTLLNQRVAPKTPPFAPVGQIEAKAGDEVGVTISNTGTLDGHVIVDSLQVLPIK